MRRINDEGLATVKQWEGLRLEAYRDGGGTLTVGYGHTGPDVTEGMKITASDAHRLLRLDLGTAERAVSDLVKVDLTDNQFAALVSLVFNIGRGHFAKSTLLRKLNAGDYAAVPSEILRWNKDTVDGRLVRVEGLANRRAAEAGLWVKGAYVASAGPSMAKPEVPPTVTKETITYGVTLLSSMGAIFAGSGPVQYALGAVIVLGALVGGYLFLRQRMAPA